MAGIIVTGHGTFAGGLLSAVRLLTGDSSQLVAVDFTAEDDEDTLRENLEYSLENMKNYGRIYVLCDILGGSPFKTAYLLARESENVRVLYGVNLPLLLEMSVNLQAGSECILELETLLEQGRESLGIVDANGKGRK